MCGRKLSKSEASSKGLDNSFERRKTRGTGL